MDTLEFINLPYGTQLTCPVEPHRFPQIVFPIGQDHGICKLCEFAMGFDEWVIAFEKDPAKWDGTTRWIRPGVDKITYEPFAKPRERMTRLFLVREDRTTEIVGDNIISYPKGSVDAPSTST